MSRKKIRKTISLLVGIAVLLVAAWQYASDWLPKPKSDLTPAAGDGLMTAYFLDVDQGDCTLFSLPDGKHLLIDAGNRGDGDEIAAYLEQLGVTKLDYVIATHPHADHIGGMSDVIEQLAIGQVFAPKIAADDVPTTQSYEDFLTAVQSKGLKITAAKAGATLFSGEDYRAECLSPAAADYDNLNNYSVAVKLTYGIHSFVLTGDAERDMETEMVESGQALSCDVFKVAHHGSSDSNSEAFLKALSPKLAVISCGEDNSYGHPHRETMTALNSLSGVEQILRTDEDQTIQITADGKSDDGLTYKFGLESVID